MAANEPPDKISGELATLKDYFDTGKLELFTIIGNEKITKEKKGEINNCVNNLGKCFDNVLALFYRQLGASAAVEELFEKSVKAIKEAVKEEISAITEDRAKCSPMLFSEVVQKKIPIKLPGGKAVTPEANSTVIIRPNDTNGSIKTSDDMKDTLLRKLDPKALGIKVKRIVRIPNKGIRIETDTPELEQKIRDSKLLEENDLNMTKTGKQKPRISVYGVKRNISDSDLSKYLTSQNDLSTSSHCKPLFRFGRKDSDETNWVVEVDPESRKKLLMVGKAYIWFGRCRVEDYTRISRCFKCQGFNHITKHCKCEHSYCAICSGQHDTRECPQPEAEPCCINCYKGKMENYKHKSSDSTCATLQRKTKELIDQTDYGED